LDWLFPDSQTSTYKVSVNAQAFGIGDFLAASITFIIVAFVVFIIAKVTRKWGIQ
jgi:large-conductance mechanosensitive channel